MKKELVEQHIADLDTDESHEINDLYKKYQGFKLKFYDYESGGGYIFTERLETDEEFEKRKKAIENAKKWNLTVKLNNYKALKAELEKEGLL